MTAAQRKLGRARETKVLWISAWTHIEYWSAVHKIPAVKRGTDSSVRGSQMRRWVLRSRVTKGSNLRTNNS